MNRVIIHSDANCFYASVEMLYHPEFAGKHWLLAAIRKPDMVSCLRQIISRRSMV